MTIIRREPLNQGTFPKEIITCRLDNETEIQIFCKYESGSNHNSYGHRGGLALESTVYHNLLKPMQVSTPTFYGFNSDMPTGEIWIVLEYLDGSVRVGKSEEPLAMPLAAKWIGEFHAHLDAHLQSFEIPFLMSYDAGYYRGWVKRALQHNNQLKQRFQWFDLLFKRFEEVVTTLLSAQQTVIHGEYYPKNILYRDGKIYPVDWESAAISPGEIDLVSLTDMWPEEIARECKFEYQAARWPDGVPCDFDRILCAAEIYLHLRWISDMPKRTIGERHFKHLHSACQRFGIV
jgi:hypothetical protein